MSNKINYNGLSFKINYDPVEELYYCGVPGYKVPTIYVGRNKKEVEDSVKDLLKDYLDFCRDDGVCPKSEVVYNVQEAYASGWIIRKIDSNVEEPNFEVQKTKHIEEQEFQSLINSIDENHPNYPNIIANTKLRNHLLEKLADLLGEAQNNRMNLINLAKETTLSHIKLGGSEILKVTRLGIAKSSANQNI